MVPLSWYLILSAILFGLGVAGFVFRRNVITVFMSIELMLNAVNLSFIAFSYQLKQVDGHIYSFFVMVVDDLHTAPGSMAEARKAMVRFVDEQISAEDFVVEEVPCAVGTEGPFLICRLTKKDWDQQRALRELARQLGISYKRIGFSGTKDKHAVTSQLISIRGITPDEIGRVTQKDLKVEVAVRKDGKAMIATLLTGKTVLH